MRYAHGSSGDERCAKERGGIRQVRFDRHSFGQLHGSRLHGPHASVFVCVDTHAGTMAPIAVASLAAVAGLFIALNNRDGDRRLVQAGMRRSALLVGRIKEVAAAVLVAAAASLTITAMVFTARQWAGFIAGTLLIGAVYALLGMCLGFLLGRVTGVLIAFVIPFLDLGITQSPMLRLEPPGAAAFLPGYGPYRVLIDTGLRPVHELDRDRLQAAISSLSSTPTADSTIEPKEQK